MYPSQTEHIFANYKRTAPSTLNMSKSFPPIPPSPPKRKSSRNNSTLRLISTMRVSSEKPAKRHQTCFISTADVNKSNVKFLRDKITCKLSSVPKRRGEAKLRVTKTLTASPELKSKVSTTLAAVKDPKTSASKIYSKTNISRDDSVERSSLSRSSSTNSVRKACRSCSATQSRKSNGTLEKSRAASLDRTFGSEKKKVDLRLSKSASEKRLIKSPDLLSPTEVKKASLITQDPFKSPIKHTRAIPKVQTKLQDLPIKVSISEKGRELLQSNAKSTSKSLRSRTDSVSPSPSLSSDKSKLSRSSTSLESIKSSKAKKDRITLKKTPSIRSLKSTTSKENLCVSKKAKKDQLNDEIVKKEKKNGKAKIRDPAKAIGKGVGSEIVKKIYRNFDSESSKNPITLEDIKRQKRNVDTSSFFQNLFLRDNPTSNSITCSANSWIAEKTLALQRRSASVSEPSIGALKIYLNHTKPVTDSKFKTMDAQLIRSRSVSPKNVRWEDETKREYSRRAVGYERSSSLPPKLVFTETSRPISPIIQRRRLDTDSTRTTIIRPTSPQKMIFTETRRPISPVLKRKSTLKRIEKKKQQPEKIIFTETARPISPEIRSRSASPKNIVKTQKSTPPETLYFSQTSRPISPVIEASPDTVIRSPSYRKIRSLHGDSLEYIRRKAPRSRSAGDADENHYKGSDFDPPSLTQSTSSIDSLKEYQTYVKEVIHSTKKSDRFKDLNKFYSTIERLGELERTTSSADLRPRRRGEEEIIDYDRWKEVRQREKAEKELGEIYKELKVTQKEKDFLFAPKQVETYRWKKDFDRGLRIKEKSVEDIREEFERLLFEDRNNNLREFDYRRDTYKPLWRGNSVANLAQTITERRSQSEGRSIPSKQKKMESERFLTRGIGSRIWSSLSMEQVNVLKNQLAEIYQNGSKKGQTQSQQPKEYIIEVPSDTYKDSQSVLTVRRNSDSSKSMSETDKRRISQSLSKEILERQRQRYKTSVSLVLGKETRGAVAAADARVKQIEPPSPRTCYSLEMSEDGDKDIKKPSDGDFLLVLAKSDTKNKANIKETLTEWAQPKKALISTDAVNIPPKTTSSESGSTDGSTKTVICVDKKEDVKKKVEYFEKVHETQDYTPTIYKAADSTSGSPEETDDVTPKSTISPLKKHSPLSRSQQDLKELFGETEMAKVASPISTIPSSGTSVKSPLTRSTESVYRSRSLSPHPDLYYFTLAKAGDVSKLKNKFERKWNSDSQIHKKSQICIPGQMLGEVDHLRRRYEYPALSGRGRSRIRRGGVVSPIYLKAEDRFMPHINIISKIASLYPRKSVREDRQDRSIENLADILGITVGEVKKLRAKFDSPDRGDVSLLGHMFTSSPNLHELRDIAPYLTASWTAHRFPKREDNERPLTPPVPPPTSAPSVVRRPKSASPPRAKAKLSSILKPEASKAAEGRKQEFNASAHRPISRYQPPAPRTQEPARYRSWWGPSVTFKGVVFNTAADVHTWMAQFAKYLKYHLYSRCSPTLPIYTGCQNYY